MDPRRVAKAFGMEPPDIAAGEAAAHMTPASPFGPGAPIRPYDGYSRTPRVHEYTPGYNISAKPRLHERISFDTLKGLIQAYDVAQMCIWHRIDSIRSLGWSLVAAPHFDGDVTDAIKIGMAVLSKPDGETPFSAWLGAYMYDILAYDAGCLHRLKNRRGDVIGLMRVDGTTIAPLLDYWGRTPRPPAEAYVQYINGLSWNWLTSDDLIYQPFRKKNDSPYGLAPLETILLNANTDIRFQVYFLQRFTEGNIPEAFASAPESWGPDQIETWQQLWDSFMAGEQAQKHTIKWIPGGSSIAWSNEKDFTDAFSLHLMRKTAAAYHVVPSDLGFTETVNLSSSESQADVQHRVGDLPLIRHLQHVLSSFLQDDLHLPLEFHFDLGEEQADRLQQAQADQIYVQIGAISPSDVRELRYGLAEPEGKPVPRFIYTTRGGPVPLSSLYAVAGPIDPATAAPEPGVPLPRTVFGGVEGVIPNPPIVVEPLAEQEFGPSAMPPAPPPQPPAPDAGQVEKDDGGAPAAGISTATGITGYDLVGRKGDDDDDEAEDREQLVKAELAAFRKFIKGRRRKGAWHNFEFQHVDPVRGRRLNQAGRLQLRKAAGEVAVAGLAVRAADTGRVLMLQRALDPEDPAAGCWEFPAGHLEDGETPLQGAWREWAEEVHAIPPPGACTGSWESADGIYQGIVWTVDSEDCVPLTGRDQVSNPDDPDGDCIEAIAWWDPAQLDSNPAVRPELLASLPDVLAALGCAPDDGEELLEKAASGKGDAPGQGASQWPGWEADLQAANHWAPVIAAALAGALTATQAQQLAAGYLAQQPAPQGDAGKAALTTAAVAWLAAQGLDLAAPLTKVLPGVYTDGYLIGLTSAQAVLAGGRAERGGWQPGDTATAQQVIGQAQAGEGLADAVALAPGTAEQVAQARQRDMARELVKGLLAGAAAKEIGAALVGVVSDAAKALTVAVTEITRAAGKAALFTYQQRDVATVRWLSEQDGKVCPACLANETAGVRPIGTPFPSGDTAPPIHPNCFPAGVMVNGPSVVAATARMYEGDLVTIVLASGQEVPVTPNHPVLTPDGWVAAGDLHEGAEVLRAGDTERIVGLLYPDDRQAVARIEDVAASLREAFAVTTGRVPLASEHFHGDGSSDHEVEVVLAEGHAEFDRVAALAHEVGELNLVVAEGPSGLPGGDSDSMLGRLGLPGGFVRRCEHGVPLLLRRPLPADGHGSGPVTAIDPGFSEHAVDGVAVHSVHGAQGLHGHAAEEVADEPIRRGLTPGLSSGASAADRDASPDQVLAQGFVADADQLGGLGQGLAADVSLDGSVQLLRSGLLLPRGQSGGSDSLSERGSADTGDGRALLDRLSGLVGVERVTEVRRVKWAGHVYNLETLDGWYFANGIIAHNCRCAVVPA